MKTTAARRRSTRPPRLDDDEDAEQLKADADATRVELLAAAGPLLPEDSDSDDDDTASRGTSEEPSKGAKKSSMFSFARKPPSSENLRAPAIFGKASAAPQAAGSLKDQLLAASKLTPASLATLSKSSAEFDESIRARQAAVLASLKKDRSARKAQVAEEAARLEKQLAQATALREGLLKELKALTPEELDEEESDGDEFGETTPLQQLRMAEAQASLFKALHTALVQTVRVCSFYEGP